MGIYRLYGDGVHDDWPAIQEMLDTGAKLVDLPAPAVSYSIGKTLKIHSGQELRLPRFARIALLDNSNCEMLENASPAGWDRNIAVRGGVWDMNHSNQWPNPYHFPNPVSGKYWKDYAEADGFDKSKRLFYSGCYSGMCFRFNSVRNFVFEDLTIVNPVVYGAQFAYIENFTVRGIIFEFNEGSPKLWNLDGVHFEGGCRNGRVENLKGATHDDLVAITADDSVYGPIDNISIDGIYAEGSHSAVRLLSQVHPVKNIHICNVFGSYYVYLVTMSKYYDVPGTRGKFENIFIDHVSASFSEGTVDVPGHWAGFIQIEHDLDIDNLVISDFVRSETLCPQPTIRIGPNTRINELNCARVCHQNLTGKPMPFLKNDGRIDSLILDRVRTGGEERITGAGTAGEIIER